MLIRSLTSFFIITILAFFSSVSAQPVTVGDFNEDGCVDEVDFRLLNAEWGVRYRVGDLNDLLENFGNCPPRISFSPEQPNESGGFVTAREGQTIELRLQATEPFSGNIRYTLRDGSQRQEDAEEIVRTAAITTFANNEAVLPVTLPSRPGFQLGESVVVAILDDDTEPRTYLPGIRFTSPVGLEDDEPLVSGLWAAQVVLTQREELAGPQPLPTGIGIPLFFRYDATTNNVTGETLPQLLPDVPYIRQVGQGVLSEALATSYSPIATLNSRPGFAISGGVSGQRLRVLVRYDAEPVIWLEPDRKNTSGNALPAASRTLVVEFPLPPSNADRLSAPIAADLVQEETGFWQQNGRESRLVLRGSAVMQFHAQQTMVELAEIAGVGSLKESKGPRKPSERSVEARRLREQREARAVPLDVAAPSFGVTLAVADFANVLSPSTAPGGAHFSGGGGIDPSGGKARFGDHVAGSAYNIAEPAGLLALAGSISSNAARYETNPAILKGGLALTEDPLVAERYIANGQTVFDNAELRRSEEIYVRAIAIDPFNTTALNGLLQTRVRRAVWYNLLADREALDAWNIKHEFPSLAGITMLQREQDQFEAVAGHALTAARLMFTMFDDRQRLGVGEVMRLTHPTMPGVKDRRDESLRVAADSLRRWSEAKRRVIQLDLLKDFLDADSRNAALDASVQAQVVLEEGIRLLAAYSQPDPVEGSDDVLLFTNPSIGLLEGELSQMREIEQDIRQGINAFGFVSDFVPFLVTNNQQSETDNVIRARQLASSLISLTRIYESEAELNLNEFVEDQVQYANRINELRTSYDERLRAMVGVIELRRIDGTALPSGVQRFYPDVLTYAMPPGNDVTSATLAVDRDDLLANEDLERAGFVFRRRSYGQIWNQHLNIQNAEDRIAQAVEDLRSNYEQMVIIEDTANRIAGVQDRLVARVKKDGQEIVLLTKELGRLRKEAILAAARAQKRGKKRAGLFGRIGTVVTALFVSTPRDGVGQLISAAASYGAQRAEIKALTQVANIDANLAVAEANIQAQIQEIQFLQQAEFLLGEQEIGLLRAQEQLKTLALQQARLSLAIRIAERDYLRELSVLDGMMAEVDSLIADAARHEQLAAQTNGVAEGFTRRDYRHAFKASQADAEAAFRRAQAATFIAVRALEYYLNESQPIGLIYERLHTARRTTHLEAVLADIDQALGLNPVIIASDCPNESVLSLKFNIIANGDIFSLGGAPETTTIRAAETFSYFDSVTGRVLTGGPAYQARLRDFLRDSLTGEPGRLRLEFSFSTDVFQRQPPNQATLPDGVPTDYFFAQNPLFNSANTRSQTFIGFTPQQCQTQTGQTFHGLTLNFVGEEIPVNQRLVLTLEQAGNQYLRSGRQDIGFDPLNQLDAMNVYSSYRQQFPRTLRLSGTGESSYETIPGSRKADFSPRVNGITPQGATGRTLVFTDRAIACDKWILTMDEATQGQGTPEFLRRLDAALDAAYRADNPAPFSFVEDIQFRIGWVPKFAQ